MIELSKKTDVNGVPIRVYTTCLVGIHTGRPRYRVKCEKCNVTIHESTTGPKELLRWHMEERHADPTCNYGSIIHSLDMLPGTTTSEVTSEITTDCKSEIGITVGLIDSLISICRVLAKRDLKSDEVLESLRDFRSDNDVKLLVNANIPYLHKGCRNCGDTGIKHTMRGRICAECGTSY